MGIAFALLAIVGWGCGDFLIQRSARKLGDWEALFFITFIATIVLLPFVYGPLASLTFFDWILLTVTSVVILFAALFDFEALRVGKISVIEPIYAMEVPVTIALATFLIGEHLTGVQISLVVTLLFGIFLVSNKHLGRIHMRTMERGVWTAVFATMGMGVTNFLFGFASRETNPLMINWFTSAFMAIATLAYLLYRREGHKILRQWRNNKGIITAVGLIDNFAWVAYSTSTLYLPIGIATGLSESYIALAAILGVSLNNERLKKHQMFGLLIALIAAVALALNAEHL